MTENTVRDSRESRDKQETGILNRLAYLKKVFSSIILHVDFENFTDVKWVSSPLLNRAFSWNEIFVFAGG